MHPTSHSNDSRAFPRLALAVRSFADAVEAECAFVVAMSANGEARCVACHPSELRPRIDALVAAGELGIGEERLRWRLVRSADGGALGWVGVVPGNSAVERATLDALLTLAAELAAMDLAQGSERSAS